jgi:hypothetical protein
MNVIALCAVSMPGGGQFGLKNEMEICLNAWIYNQASLAGVK